MKVKNTKLIQKAEGRKKGKYEITLLVTDYDLEMIESLAQDYSPWDHSMFQDKEHPWKEKKALVGIEVLDFNDKFRRWLNKTWRCFWKVWNLYDEDLK